MLGKLWFLYLFLVVLIGCKSSDQKRYESVINDATRFELVLIATGKTKSIPAEAIKAFKEELLNQSLNRSPVKFEAALRIDIFSGEQETGSILIGDGASARFQSESTTTYFNCSYRLGRWVEDEMYEGEGKDRK